MDLSPATSESDLEVELKALKAVIDNIVTQLVTLLPKVPFQCPFPKHLKSTPTFAGSVCQLTSWCA
eukprot:1200655-Amphidinium_carterae.2